MQWAALGAAADAELIWDRRRWRGRTRMVWSLGSGTRIPGFVGIRLAAKGAHMQRSKPNLAVLALLLVIGVRAWFAFLTICFTFLKM